MTPQNPEPLRFAVLAADIALFTIREATLLVRLIRVNRPPHFPGVPGLPGGLLDATETAEEAAIRHLKGRTGISSSHIYMEQLATFSAVNRDPRSRAVAVAYIACVPWDALTEEERKDTDDSWWSPAHEKTTLAYDHNEVLAAARARLRSRITYTTLIAQLMPEEFTLTELERTYECILERDLDKRNFRKKILKLGILKELPKKRRGGRSRPAQLYTFASKDVKEIEVL
ncbi:MAG TPA: NUDIX domain-containing protein [Candidatus Paceibacterota bacterium]|nr:NUDIX domain-containing protein [Candidatus Paceibacterota bacterium]